ncbi:hypothetical protein AAHA92_09797 [Salvia divinorum]|uniref:Chromo domain-containing protein n=1 Tax=Salvia divinorum TaxID=28513 RepID=A0ABD1HSL7_SALDI
MILNPDLSYEEKPEAILDRKVQELRNKAIASVKVLWKHHGYEEATWELEDKMKEKFPRALLSLGEPGRDNKIDNTQRDETTPPTSVISLAPMDASPTVGDVNYVLNSGGPNRTFNNYRPNQGGGFNVSKGGVVEPPKKDEKERYEQGIQRILEGMQ